MIVEGIVTTLGAEGRVNVAPMGPVTDARQSHLVFRPFKTSQTYRNLREHPEGVFHIVDDVELLAHACLGEIDSRTTMRQAERVCGRVLGEACRYFEFRVKRVDDRQDRATIEVEILLERELRPFFGFNRARHAVVEATILASRVGILDPEAIVAGLDHVRPWVEKTGGERERRAFEYVESQVEGALRERAAAGARLRGGSRLHFGLFSPSAGQGRRHGGAGVMIDAPAVEIVAQRQEAWQVCGPSAARVERAARAWTHARGADGSRGSLRMEIVEAPPEHVGLGAGTQLELAAGRLAARVLDRTDPGLLRLAQITGRGARSAVGAYGFERGGLIVDGGHARQRDLPGGRVTLAPLISRVELPHDWRFLVLLAEDTRGLSGDRERDAFAALEDAAGNAAGGTEARELGSLVLLGLLPAAAEGDFHAFSDALGRLQDLVGDMFSRVQGGRFSTRQGAAAVAHWRRRGLRGCGQSSWGPTVFAVAESEERALAERSELCEQLDVSPSRVCVARPRNHGARIIPLGD